MNMCCVLTLFRFHQHIYLQLKGANNNCVFTVVIRTFLSYHMFDEIESISFM